MTIRYLTVEEVMLLNHHIIKELSPEEPIGIIDHNLLESAVNRPKQTLFEKDAYPTVAHKGAALFESIAQNHIFANANKRTALAALFFFMRYNKQTFYMGTNDAVDFVLDVVLKKISFEKAARTIASCSFKG